MTSAVLQLAVVQQVNRPAGVRPACAEPLEQVFRPSVKDVLLYCIAVTGNESFTVPVHAPAPGLHLQTRGPAGIAVHYMKFPCQRQEHALAHEPSMMWNSCCSLRAWCKRRRLVALKLDSSGRLSRGCQLSLQVPGYGNAAAARQAALCCCQTRQQADEEQELHTALALHCCEFSNICPLPCTT